MSDRDFIQLKLGILGNHFPSNLNNYNDTQLKTLPCLAVPEKVNSEMEQIYPSFSTHCWMCELWDSFQCSTLMMFFLQVDSARGRGTAVKRWVSENFMLVLQPRAAHTPFGGHLNFNAFFSWYKVLPYISSDLVLAMQPTLAEDS